MVPRTSVQVQSRSKLPAMYCITHKIIRLSQVICANGSRKLFRFRVRQFSGLKYYFTREITRFRNLFSVCPGFRYIGGPFQAGFTVYSNTTYRHQYGDFPFLPPYTRDVIVSGNAGPIACPTTSVTEYQTMLRNIPEDCRSKLQHAV